VRGVNHERSHFHSRRPCHNVKRTRRFCYASGIVSSGFRSCCGSGSRAGQHD